MTMMTCRMRRVVRKVGGALASVSLRGALCLLLPTSTWRGRGSSDGKCHLIDAFDRSLTRADEQINNEARLLVARLQHVMPFLILFFLKYIYLHAIGESSHTTIPTTTVASRGVVFEPFACVKECIGGRCGGDVWLVGLGGGGAGQVSHALWPGRCSSCTSTRSGGCKCLSRCIPSEA